MLRLSSVLVCRLAALKRREERKRRREVEESQAKEQPGCKPSAEPSKRAKAEDGAKAKADDGGKADIKAAEIVPAAVKSEVSLSVLCCIYLSILSPDWQVQIT